jgi:hypothetical protein
MAGQKQSTFAGNLKRGYWSIVIGHWGQIICIYGQVLREGRFSLPMIIFTNDN